MVFRINKSSLDLVVILTSILLVTTTGCGSSSQISPITSADNPPVAKKHIVKNVEPPRETSTVDLVEEKPPVESKGDDQPTKTKSAHEDDATHERFLLLAPDGPLIVELVMTSNGKKLQSAREPLIEKFMAAGDANRDGTVTWDEALTVPRIMYGGFGNARLTEPAQRRQAMQVFDTNRDGEIGHEEAVRFVTNDTGANRSITLSASSYFRDLNKSRSSIRTLLDEDQDGSLSRDEIDQSAERLVLRDGDDDRVLYPGDFVATADLQDNRAMRRGSGPRPAMNLRPASNWSRVRFALEALYAFGGDLTTESLSFTPTLFSQLDANSDSKITDVEMEAIDELEAHLQLTVAFNSTTNEAAASQIEIVKQPNELQKFIVATLPMTDRLSIELPMGRLDFAVRDLTAGQSFEQRGSSIVDQFDKNKNGYLEDSEAVGDEFEFIAPFAAVDLDGDGKVYASEISEFLAIQQMARKGRVRVQVNHHEDALFSMIDLNTDGRIDEKELLHSRSRLIDLDANKDDQVTVDEIPDCMIVTISLGEDRQDFRPGPTSALQLNADTNIPRWFRSMDTNQDGLVSQKEFLGKQTQFEQLDENGDGFLDRDESKPVTSD